MRPMIELESRGEVAVAHLRHGKANTIDTEFFEALGQRLEEVRESSARALVITGQGRIFSAGVDLRRLLSEDAAYLARFLPALDEGLMDLFEFPLPTVAAVNGHAIAGGCILACACDVRLMADGEASPARIGVPELKVGVPFPAGPVEVLRFAAGTATAELVLLGRTYPPVEARERGLIDELVSGDELLEAACDRAARLAQVGSRAYAMTKRLLKRPAVQRFQASAAETSEEVLSLWADDEIRGAVRRYVEATLR